MLSNIASGAGVAVVAPAGPVDEARYRAGLGILAARYRLVHAYDPTPVPLSLPYLAAADDTRAAWLNQAIADERVQAIFCARGGYGSLRLVDRLDGQTFARRRPLLVGFSDITVLHAWAGGLGVPTVHGPVVTQLPRLSTARCEALWALLEDGRVPILDGLTSVTPGKARGKLVGGNLAVLTHLLGTPYFPCLDGAILLLEDVGERPYRVDRMLTQLLLSGKLTGLTGVVVGQMLNCDKPLGHPPRMVEARSVLIERLGNLGIPLVMGLPVGHEDDNLALPLGVEAELDAHRGRLAFHGAHPSPGVLSQKD